MTNALFRAPFAVLCFAFSRFDVTDGAQRAKPTAAHPKRWLLISQPSEKTISFVSLPRGDSLKEDTTMHVLINGSSGNSDLQMPMGLAVDQYNGRLVVADPTLKQILSYRLSHTDDPGSLSVGSSEVLADNVEARWVAVDPSSNVFFTDEAANNISVIMASNAGGYTKPAVIYSGALTSSVSSPGGIAADSMRVYWVNKQLGSQSGSVMSAPKFGVRPGQDENRALISLSSNTDKSYGLCRAMANLFYTQPDKQIFGVEADGQGGGATAVVTDRLTNPRGCAFDGDGTVYVADRGAGAVYSYAGNMQTLGYALMQKTATMNDAFGAAVFSGTCRSIISKFALWLALGFVVRHFA